MTKINIQTAFVVTLLYPPILGKCNISINYGPIALTFGTEVQSQ